MSHTARLLDAAITHHQSGRMAEAEKAYRKLLRVAPADLNGLRLLGGLYVQTGRMEFAIEVLEKAARQTEVDPETLTNLGLALRYLGQTDKARARYEQARALQPDYVPALTHLASLFQDTGNLSEATELYGRILQLSPENPVAHFQCGNILYVAGKAREAMTHYENALRLKPDYCDAMVNLGVALCQTGQGSDSRQWLGIAQTWFEKALKEDPANIVALNNMGNVMRQTGKPEEAVAYYREALRLKPTYAQALINLATSLRDLNLLEEALEASAEALRLEPHSADARINRGTFLQDLSRHEEAVVSFDEALALKPSSIDAQWNKSLSLLALGDYAPGWRLHEVGLGIAHMRGECPSPERQWRGDSLTGKRLLLWSEQGFGDTLHFVRYAALCTERGGKVHVLCPPPLRGLLKNCPFIDALPAQALESDYDLQAPLMSLPHIFDTRIETIPAPIPYLFVSPETRARWAKKEMPETGLKVGLVWAGNPRPHQLNAHMIDRRRSLSLETLRPLFDLPSIHFYTLQMGAASAQRTASGLPLIDFMGEVQDFEDTAALIERLDLVISVDTSVVHLAGGLGKPVWVLSRFDACWRWLQNRPDNPWYPSARVFGQKRPGAWEEVVVHVKEALNALR